MLLWSYHISLKTFHIDVSIYKVMILDMAWKQSLLDASMRTKDSLCLELIS